MGLRLVQFDSEKRSSTTKANDLYIYLPTTNLCDIQASLPSKLSQAYSFLLQSHVFFVTSQLFCPR
jgi:hypothetical protein